MKIKIYTMYFLPEFGSAPILMNELATYLASRGHKVEIITTFPRQRKERNQRINICLKEKYNGFYVTRFWTNASLLTFGRFIAWNLYTMWCIFYIVRIKRGDILFLRLSPLQLGLVGVIAKKLKGVKVILDIQDIYPDQAIEVGILKNSLLIKLAKMLEKWIYRYGDIIMVLGEGFKVNLQNKGVNPEKLKVVPNWTDTDFFKVFPKDNYISQKFSLVDKFVIMFTGTITLSNYSTLRRIMETADLFREERKILFVVVGEGMKKKALEKEARKLYLPNVRFMSFVSYNYLPYLLASSDILLVPLDTSKTGLMPSKVYTFMAAERPILCLAEKGSEIANLITETNCGLCVTPEDAERIKDAIQRLRVSDEYRKTLGENGRRCILEHFSKEKILKIHEDLISSLQ